VSTTADLLHGYDDFLHFVSPELVRRAELSHQPWRWARVADGVLFDAHGHAVHDMVSGWGTQIFGHRPAQIEAAARAFLDSDAPSLFTTGISPWAGLLARALYERTGYERSYFISGGTEAVESALKLARAATGRPATLYLDGAYHGCTLGSCAMMHPGVYRDPFEPHPSTFRRLPFDDIPALQAALQAGDVAAVVVEPIQVEGGLRALSSAYVEALCALTQAHDALLIADEIQTGLGRTGALLATASWPRPPDALTLAKALGGGVMPISALLTTQPWHQRAYGDFHRADAHNSTFTGNGLAAATALATLDALSPAFLTQTLSHGEAFGARLQEALADNPLVAEVRGCGMMWGVALRHDPDLHPWLTFEGLHMDDLKDKPSLGLLLCHRLYRAGFFCQVCGHDWSVLRVQPPLNTSPALLSRFTQACTEALDFLCQLT
jgi:acetylornithine/succinyldiaminopimelate/putrescine aminotransferase